MKKLFLVIIIMLCFSVCSTSNLNAGTYNENYNDSNYESFYSSSNMYIGSGYVSFNIDCYINNSFTDSIVYNGNSSASWSSYYGSYYTPSNLILVQKIDTIGLGFSNYSNVPQNATVNGSTVIITSSSPSRSISMDYGFKVTRNVILRHTLEVSGTFEFSNGASFRTSATKTDTFF